MSFSNISNLFRNALELFHKKEYYYIDNKNEIKTKNLNFFAQIFRNYFRFYKDTHSKNIISQVTELTNLSDPKVSNLAEENNGKKSKFDIFLLTKINSLVVKKLEKENITSQEIVDYVKNRNDYVLNALNNKIKTLELNINSQSFVLPIFLDNWNNLEKIVKFPSALSTDSSPAKKSGNDKQEDELSANVNELLMNAKNRLLLSSLSGTKVEQTQTIFRELFLDQSEQASIKMNSMNSKLIQHLSELIEISSGQASEKQESFAEFTKKLILWTIERDPSIFSEAFENLNENLKNVILSDDAFVLQVCLIVEDPDVLLRVLPDRLKNDEKFLKDFFDQSETISQQKWVRNHGYPERIHRKKCDEFISKFASQNMRQNPTVMLAYITSVSRKYAFPGMNFSSTLPSTDEAIFQEKFNQLDEKLRVDKEFILNLLKMNTLDVKSLKIILDPIMDHIITDSNFLSSIVDYISLQKLVNVLPNHRIEDLELLKKFLTKRLNCFYLHSLFKPKLFENEEIFNQIFDNVDHQLNYFLFSTYSHQTLKSLITAKISTIKDREDQLKFLKFIFNPSETPKTYSYFLDNKEYDQTILDDLILSDSEYQDGIVKHTLKALDIKHSTPNDDNKKITEKDQSQLADDFEWENYERSWGSTIGVKDPNKFVEDLYLELLNLTPRIIRENDVIANQVKEKSLQGKDHVDSICFVRVKKVEPIKNN